MPRGLFTRIPDDERREQLAAFAEFVARRDGVPDLRSRTLSRREEVLRRLEAPAVTFPGRIDPALFAAQYARYDGGRPTSREMLLLLVLLKINAAETYSVENALVMMSRCRNPQRGVRLATLLQECYHTKILLSSARLFGVPAEFQYQSFFRLIKALDVALFRLPDSMSDALKLASEIYSVIIFTRILQATRDIVGHDPVLRDALEERVTEVLVDEVGHVSYARLCLGTRGLAAAKMLLPLIAMALRGPIPEARALGILPVPLAHVRSFDLRQVPEEVRRRAFVA